MVERGQQTAMGSPAAFSSRRDCHVVAKLGGRRAHRGRWMQRPSRMRWGRGRLRRVLRALAAAGVFCELEDGRSGAVLRGIGRRRPRRDRARTRARLEDRPARPSTRHNAERDQRPDRARIAARTDRTPRRSRPNTHSSSVKAEGRRFRGSTTSTPTHCCSASASGAAAHCTTQNRWYPDAARRSAAFRSCRTTGACGSRSRTWRPTTAFTFPSSGSGSSRQAMCSAGRWATRSACCSRPRHSWTSQPPIFEKHWNEGCAA